MNRQIAINLPVTDLPASIAFYESLGFKKNRQFTDETAACLAWSEAIIVMLLTHEKWKTFTSRPIPPNTSSEVMLALSCENREVVDKLNRLAEDHGGTGNVNPLQDHGVMYSRAFADLDGHLWEAFWMDPAFVDQMTPA